MHQQHKTPGSRTRRVQGAAATACVQGVSKHDTYFISLLALLMNTYCFIGYLPMPPVYWVQLARLIKCQP